MQRGIDLEPKAFDAYEAHTGAMVFKSGFLQHTQHMAGCSLDGHINKFSGIVEIKCPKMATHLTYLNSPELFAAEYSAQVRHNLWITGAPFCDLVSFDDRLPPKLQFFRVRVEAYDADIKGYEAAALKFLEEVQTQYDQIMAAA
jgi:exodeoxyribonuclease (lambda-induced)